MKRFGFWVVGIIFVTLILVAVFGGHGKHPKVAVKTKGNYVALGDSVAAGVGLGGDSDSSACDRTNQAYPDLVAQVLHYKLSNLACSGATLPAGILGSQTVNNLAETPQLTALFKLPQPKLVSITIGANDADWTGIIAKCYTSDCGSAADTAAVDARLTTVTANLQMMLASIKAHYATPPLTVVTGYHQVFPSTAATCSDLTGIDSSELAWGRQQQASINSTIQVAVANYPFAKFAAVNFSGHELCTSQSWVQGLADSEPYHPTAVGQSTFAKSVEAAARQ